MSLSHKTQNQTVTKDKRDEKGNITAKTLITRDRDKFDGGGVEKCVPPMGRNNRNRINRYER